MLFASQSGGILFWSEVKCRNFYCRNFDINSLYHIDKESGITAGGKSSSQFHHKNLSRTSGQEPWSQAWRCRPRTPICPSGPRSSPSYDIYIWVVWWLCWQKWWLVGKQLECGRVKKRRTCKSHEDQDDYDDLLVQWKFDEKYHMECWRAKNYQEQKNGLRKKNTWNVGEW